MARRSTHLHVAILGAVAAFALMSWAGGAGPAAIGALACIFAEAFMGPDRDQPSRAGMCSPLGLFWWPYSRLSHRGMLSHWPVVSTAVRTAYMGAPIVAALMLAGVDVEALALQHEATLWWAAGGLELSTWLHGIADIKRE